MRELEKWVSRDSGGWMPELVSSDASCASADCDAGADCVVAGAVLEAGCCCASCAVEGVASAAACWARAVRGARSVTAMRMNVSAVVMAEIWRGNLWSGIIPRSSGVLGVWGLYVTRV
jgi:hypothetical protein